MECLPNLVIDVIYLKTMKALTIAACLALPVSLFAQEEEKKTH